MKEVERNSSYSRFFSTNKYVQVLKPYIKKQTKEYNSYLYDYIEINNNSESEKPVSDIFSDNYKWKKKKEVI